MVAAMMARELERHVPLQPKLSGGRAEAQACTCFVYLFVALHFVYLFVVLICFICFFVVLVHFVCFSIVLVHLVLLIC